MTEDMLTTPWYVMTIKAKCVAWCQEKYLTILLVIKDSFGELMMLLVTKDSRVLKNF